MTESIDGTRLGEADTALKNGEYAKALALYEALAQTGSAHAMFMLAVMYGRGLGVARDCEKIRYWSERAYAKGDGPAAVELHKIYGHGKYGVSRDEEKAFRYVRMFERVEHPDLYQALGVFLVASAYERGRGVAKDIPKAVDLYRRAAAAGHIPSKINWSLLQMRHGNLLAIVPWLFAVLHGQFLVVSKGPQKGWNDLRMRV